MLSHSFLDKDPSNPTGILGLDLSCAHRTLLLLKTQRNCRGGRQNPSLQSSGFRCACPDVVAAERGVWFIAILTPENGEAIDNVV